MELSRVITTSLFAITIAFQNNADAKNMRSYTNNSVLSSGHAVKIRVKDEGLYSFTYKELRNMGFSNPKNVHLRGYGGELLNEDFTESNHYVDDLADQPVVDLGDRIAFYLRGSVGFAKINAYITNNIGFSENYASDYSYYFLKEEGTEAKRVPLADALPENEYKQTSYTDIKWQKYDEVNLARSGRNWYGSKFKNGESKTFTFSFDNLIPEEKGRIYSSVVSASSDTGIFNLNTNLEDVSRKFGKTNKETYGLDGILQAEALPSSPNTISATFKYTSLQKAGVGYIDYIIAAGKCALKGDAGYKMIPVAPTDLNEYITYAALSSSSNTQASNIQVWDVSEIGDVKRVPTRISKDSIIFTVKTRPTVGRYIMTSWEGGFQTPEIVGNVDNQNLHALKDIEYVVVTNPEFIVPARDIANFHKEKDGMSTAVVTPNQVYNEFSSGTPDPTAIRAFLKMLWDRASESEYGIYPQYLLLVGDGTYDNKGKLKNQEYNKLITYQTVNSLDESNSCSSDDYFCYVEDNSLGYNRIHWNERMNIGVGRFPVSNVEQAEILVDKVKQYYALETGDWRKKFVAIGDDNEKEDAKNKVNYAYHDFLYHQEEALGTLNDIEPRMDVSRIYWDNYKRDKSGGATRYPGATEAITNKFEEGALIFSYLGHSSYNAISAEHAYSITQAKSIYNKVYPVWIAGSCNLSQFDDNVPCFGEEIMLNPNGGAIASIGSTRVAYTTANLTFNKEFIRQAFNPDNDYRLGKIIREAKSAQTNNYSRLIYVVLGDPGLRLKVPELTLKVDSVVGMDDERKTKDEERKTKNENRVDTLKALSKVKVLCHVEDETGNILTQFNGIANATLKDKAVKCFTKGNEPQVDPFSYYDYQSILYNGSATVKNGKFEFQMIIPKDLNYNVGYGRLSMYGYDQANGWDAMGVDDDLLIGGNSNNTKEDKIGPEIILTTNGDKYKDGYKVNPRPMVYVNLSDPSGINVTGSSVGHNITLTIDDNTKNVIRLNSYFSYDMGSCTEGSVAYHIDEALSEGWHTFKVKAWDLQSNSSEATMRVYVTENQTPEIETLTVYPNPATDRFTISMKTNRPDEVQTVECSLTDMSGREFSRKEIKDKSTDGTWKIEWNLHEKGKMEPGLYLLRLRVATEGTDFAEKSEKIVVIAQ